MYVFVWQRESESFVRGYLWLCLEPKHISLSCDPGQLREVRLPQELFQL